MPDNPTGQENTPQAPQKPTFNWDDLIDPTNGKIMGKYDDLGVFKKSYWDQNNGAAELARENRMLKELFASGERISPQERQRERAPYEDNLQALGIPVSDLDQFVQSRAEKVAEKMVESKFSPLMQTMQARTQMAQEYPEYLAKEAEVMAFVQKSPNLSQDFNELASLKPLAALKYAWSSYREHLPRSASPEQEAARAAAAIPGNVNGGSPGSRTPFQGGPQQQDLQTAFAYHKNTRDEKPFLDAWFANKPLTWTEQMMAQMKSQQ